MKTYKTIEKKDYCWHSLHEADPVFPSRELNNDADELLVCFECVDSGDAKMFGTKPLTYLRYETIGICEWSGLDGRVVDGFTKWKRDPRNEDYMERIIAWKYIEPFEAVWVE